MQSQGKVLDGVTHLVRLRNSVNRPPARQQIFVGYARDSYDGKWYGPDIRHNEWKIIQGETAGPFEMNSNPVGGSQFPQVGGE